MVHPVCLKKYWVRIPAGSDIFHRGCAYTVLQTIQKPGQYNVVYGIVHEKEPLPLFDKSRT